jgi:protein-L-isoaspartate(D-aspartate) O-methyltransferase
MGKKAAKGVRALATSDIFDLRSRGLQRGRARRSLERARGVLDALIARGCSEYEAITTGDADGYYGWPQAAPFDKIIVTCGIDHVPPPLLQQLRSGGIMVIPVGPPGAQRLLKIVKEREADGTIKVTRLDIYGGRIIPFVPFTKLDGDTIKGTHNQR